jgi:hypothetical protein
MFWDKRASNFEKKPIKTVQNANFEIISMKKLTRSQSTVFW